MALSGIQRVFDIEIVELLDLPRIELLDGDAYKDSTMLSTGQKCTTILPILLLESESPLLIDQPEDNLDNRFIYETVVKSVSEMKAKRQLLFVTHNPNIPVLGDAEKVQLQQYVTACYGALTTFNVLFAEPDDRFKGASKKD